MADNIISYLEMCHREGTSLQAGMNFGLGGNHSVILMSVRPNAPYRDRLEDGGTTLIYEGHDEPKGGEDAESETGRPARTLPVWRSYPERPVRSSCATGKGTPAFLNHRFSPCGSAGATSRPPRMPAVHFQAFRRTGCSLSRRTPGRLPRLLPSHRWIRRAPVFR